MENWYELKSRTDKTDAEKVVVVCVEAIHKSETMETESEEKTYNNLCERAGLTKPDLVPEDEVPPEDTGDSDDDEIDSEEDAE